MTASKTWFLLLVIEKLRRGKEGAPAAPALLYIMDINQRNSLGVSVKKGIQQHVVDHA